MLKVSHIYQMLKKNDQMTKRNFQVVTVLV